MTVPMNMCIVGISGAGAAKSHEINDSDKDSSYLFVTFRPSVTIENFLQY